jgi:hypothetical protein
MYNSNAPPARGREEAASARCEAARGGGGGPRREAARGGGGGPSGIGVGVDGSGHGSGHAGDGRAAMTAATPGSLSSEPPPWASSLPPARPLVSPRSNLQQGEDGADGAAEAIAWTTAPAPSASSPVDTSIWLRWPTGVSFSSGYSSSSQFYIFFCKHAQVNKLYGCISYGSWMY